MSLPSTERGALPAPVLLLLVVLLLAGGVAWFVLAGPGAENAKAPGGHGFEKTDPLFLADPEGDAQPPEIPAVEPEAEEILKGELIRFRDATGAVKFRTREKVAGFNQRGETIWWQPEMRVGPSMGSSKLKNKAKGIRRKATPPRLVLRNGRAMMRTPNAPSGKKPGAGGQGAGASEEKKEGTQQPTPDVTGGGG